MNCRINYLYERFPNNPEFASHLEKIELDIWNTLKNEGFPRFQYEGINYFTLSPKMSKEYKHQMKVMQNMRDKYGSQELFLMKKLPPFDYSLIQLSISKIEKKEFEKFNNLDKTGQQEAISTSSVFNEEAFNKYQKIKNMEDSKPNDLQEGLEWINKILPDANVELVNDLIDGIARGSFNSVNELITFSKKYANKKTAKHEMFHLAFNRLSKEKQEELLNEGSKLFNIPRGRNEVITKYSQQQQNEINYVLKAVDILQSDKAKQVFEKGKKASWDLNKILTELQIPKDQKQLILDSGITDREEIALALATNYSYSVEINTTKKQEVLNNKTDGFVLNNKYYIHGFDSNGNQSYEVANIIDSENFQMWEPDTYDEFVEISKEDYLKAREQTGENTQHYSNLTVPGGTNYTENEISTPAITPSIKGHAQFATDNGIGWIRSDDKRLDTINGQWINDENKIPNEFSYLNFNFSKKGGEWEVNGNIEEDIRIILYNYNLSIGNSITKERPKEKTRRLLELQSDLFQKGRDKEDLILKQKEDSLYTGIKQETTQELYKEAKNKGKEVFAYHDYYYLYNNKYYSYSSINNKYYVSENNSKINTSENQFLQLLNKDNNWVTFFVKSIIQDSAKKGYEKVLFPSGNTAAKVEGHQTLEEFKKQKEDRIKELEKQKENGTKIVERYLTDEAGQPYSSIDVKIDEEINQLKQELERVEIEGFGALRPIYNFYENTVQNILKKQFGQINRITDEYSNEWFEINLSNPKVREQIENIKFQSPKLEYKGDLAIEEKIAEMMENTPDEQLPKTLIGKWIQSVRNFFRNLFKEKTKIERILRNINQGKIENSTISKNPAIKYQALTAEQTNQIEKLSNDEYEDNVSCFI